MLVGTARFELATSSTPRKRAPKLSNVQLTDIIVPDSIGLVK